MAVKIYQISIIQLSGNILSQQLTLWSEREWLEPFQKQHYQLYHSVSGKRSKMIQSDNINQFGLDDYHINSS